jgi:hypothetical protein
LCVKLTASSAHLFSIVDITHVNFHEEGLLWVQLRKRRKM